MSVTEARAQKYAYTVPIAEGTSWLMKRKGDDRISSVEDAAEMVVGNQLASAGEVAGVTMMRCYSTFSVAARLMAMGFTLALLGGCTTFSDKGGFEVAEKAAREYLGQKAVWLRDDESRAAAAAEVDRLLDEVLTPESTMQIALLNNPGLQAAYAELGMSEADFVQAGRVANPGFSYANTTGGGTQEIERGLEFSVMSILTMPFRVGIEARRFEAAKLRAAGDTVGVALEAREAYFEAVAARQALGYMRDVIEAADASRELMARLKRVGNASRIELAREQLFHAEATTALAQATQRELASRETLIRLLGLWGSQLDFELPERLPDLPNEPQVLDTPEQLALAQRLDLQLFRHDLDAFSEDLGLTRATRFGNVLDVGPAQVRDSGEPVRDGYHIMFEIPIFDWGDARVARAEAAYTQASERFAQAAIDARSQVRLAYLGYRTAFDIAKHYRDEIVPLRKRISDEQLLLYNGMLVGVFELIADAREQVVTVNGYMEALKDFWIADTRLQHALLNTTSPSVMQTVGVSAMPSGGEESGGH